MQYRILFAFLLLATSKAEPTQDVELLRKWSLRLGSAVDEMRNTELCTDLKSFGPGAQYSVRQNVQRFGRFDQTSVQDDNAKYIAKMMASESEEVELKHKQLELMIASLESTTDEKQFDEVEVQAMVTRARRVLSDERLGYVWLMRAPPSWPILGARSSQACVRAVLVKPMLMYREPVLAVPQSTANSSVLLAIPEVTMRQQSLAGLDEMHGSRTDDDGDGWTRDAWTTWQNGSWLGEMNGDAEKRHAWDQAADRYAMNHCGTLSIFAWFPGSELLMMPLSGVGPEMPVADKVYCGGSNSYVKPTAGGSFSVTQDMCLDLNPCNGLFYFDSCEFGPLTMMGCDLERQRNFLWMVPIFGNFLGSFPARQVPGRTCFGSHPSQYCFGDERMTDYLPGGVANQEAIWPVSPTLLEDPPIASWRTPPPTETHLSYTSSVYDRELVPLLYQLDAQNARFQRVTFFTTTLTQAAAIGVQPSGVHYDHWGVELTVAPDSPGLPLLRGFTGKEARVLSVEMMTQGLLWSLKQQEMAPNAVHSSETFEFDNLPVNVVADFLFERRGKTYKDEDCQQFARNLMDRIFVYGQSPRAIGKYADEVPLLTWRAYLLGGVALLPMVTYLALLFVFVSHLRNEFREGGEGLAIKCVHAVRLLDESLHAGEEKGQRYIGKRASFLARISLALYFQPLAMVYVYDACCAVKTKLKCRKVDFAEPLLAN